MTTYILKIFTESKNHQKISDCLGINNNTGVDYGYWGFEVAIGENTPNIDFLSFIDKELKHKLKEIKNIGLGELDIQLWILYAYDEQCNLEFSPTEMKILYELGISLCISCWEK